MVISNTILGNYCPKEINEGNIEKKKSELNREKSEIIHQRNLG